MSQSADTLVEDRISQLQEISKRRNQLLREMYHLIQRRDDLGSVLALDEDHGEDLQMFLERFDLEKHPDTGHVSNLSDAELLGLPPSQPILQDTVDEGATARSLVHAAPGSPMSEPPASPSATGEQEQEEELAYPESQFQSTEMVDEELPEGRSTPSRSSAPAEEQGSDDILILEPQPQRGKKRKRPIWHHSLMSDEDRDELDLIGSPSPVMRRSTSTRTRSVTVDESRHESEIPYSSPSPQPAVLDGEQEATQPNIYKDTKQEEDANYDAEWDELFTGDASEDTVDHLLLPSSLLELPATPTIETHRPVDYVIPAPVPLEPIVFNFDFRSEPADELMPPTTPEKAVPPDDFLHFKPDYTLPPLSVLPAEFNRKGKLTRHQKKREKEKERGEKGTEREGKKEDWAPIGINKWGAIVRANPVWKTLSRATKCLSTHDWNIAVIELRLIRTLDRVETLKENGWSYRQPKKQRGVGSMMKTHWDYLMDEMKWMRIDFREERRWKIALAFTLSHAVMDWHAAGTLEERVRKGICVLWKRPRSSESESIEEESGIPEEVELPDMEEDCGADSRETNTPANDYGSDDDSEDEQDKEQRHLFDSLAPENMLEEAVRTRQDSSTSNEGRQSGQDAERVEPKVEYVDDLAALHNSGQTDRHDTMEVDSEESQKVQIREDHTPVAKGEEPNADTTKGLKSDSKDPVLGVPEGQVARSPTKSKSKSNVYAPLREQIMNCDIDQLFLDLDDIDLVKGMSELSTNQHPHSVHPPAPDLAAIFPDLTPLGLLDPVSGTCSGDTDGRKKSDKKVDKDDPHKRVEESSYSKMVPTSEFMYVKPTILGALQPSRHWHDGRWDNNEEIPVVAEPEPPSARMLDESYCSLFDGNKPNSPSALSLSLPGASKDARKRSIEFAWTPHEDVLLKQLAEKYPNNWALIADAFNSSRVTIPSDRRSALDCFERWNVRWGGNGRSLVTEDDSRRSLVASSPTQMTTRGTKRSATVAMALTNANVSKSAVQPESKKRQRHALMYDAIRKAMKKKDAALKANSIQRKTTAVHDTHGQINKMPKLTPAELSRLKAEKEARDNQELLMRRRNEAEIARQQHMLREQAQRIPTQQAQQPQQQVQQQPQNGVARQVAAGLPQTQVPQIRSQVGISQQQRLSNPMALANARLSPTQVMQAQAQARALAAQAHAQAQAAASGALGGAASGMSSNHHLSPPYAARATSSSPGLPQQSPPLPPGTPSNGTNSPRPPSTQPHVGMTAASQNVPINSVPRPATNMGYYHVPSLHGAQITAEQAMQLQNLQNLFRRQNAANHAQNAQNGSYSQS